jgi:hypothetical protein
MQGKIFLKWLKKFYRMEGESEKYRKVLDILRKSKPVLNSTEDIEREVIRRISRNSKSRISAEDITDFLFGWVYIGWVRRSLIAASVLLVMIFVYQQGVILKQISYLSRQTVSIKTEAQSIPAGEIEKQLMIYKLSGRKVSSGSITVSEKQMLQLLDSVNELQSEYRDLIKLIEDDPELKKLIENKMTGNKRVKTKL